MRLIFLLFPAVLSSFGLIGCVSAPVTTHTTLSATQDLSPGKAGRAQIKEKRNIPLLNTVSKVYIHPTKLAIGQHTRYSLSDKERNIVLNEIEAQICFELSERYEIVSNKDVSSAEVYSAVTWFEPTGAAASGAAAVAGQFIPGPIGLRLPGSLGGLGAEAEMIKDGSQIAAIVWARRAQAIGTDTPSLSRLGDALQFAEPFADEAARIMSPDPLPPKREYTKHTDPCAQYGGRIDGRGFVTKAITGLYNPTQRSDTQDETDK
ncbi:DUF3313 family protein [Asticcacaulis machinosus]|uniref:DUF3313 family protein n=1 Tax=Asticcacaulis machinosus TaxID=2984211 RepID=A0ABT5HF11_9CAUL|nr:DUF3313 family protein [Asticcacaulis machinosus]MDC7674851.1 DUF3313 family protein [Asticcacaulis machinosus]